MCIKLDGEQSATDCVPGYSSSAFSAIIDFIWFPLSSEQLLEADQRHALVLIRA